MTQAQLAQRIGVTRQTIIAIEQGRYSPSLEMAFQIAQVFRWHLTKCSSIPTERQGHDEGRRLLARHFGAIVTGVCSGANTELVRTLGAEAGIFAAPIGPPASR